MKWHHLMVLLAVMACAVVAADGADPADDRAARVAALTAAADQSMAQKDYAAAVKQYGDALAIERGSAALWVAYGDALNQLSPKDPEYAVRAQRSWATAVSVDASYKPALERMLKFLGE